MTYSFSTLKSIPANFKPVSGDRIVRLIFKGDENRESMFTTIRDVTENYIDAFLAKQEGREAVADMIRGLQNKAMRAAYIAKNKVDDNDVSIEALYAIAQSESETVRLTKEVIKDMFAKVWANRIAYSIAIERDAGAIVALESDSAGYWNSENGLKFLQIAQNYLVYLMRASERKPSFETAAIKAKVLGAIDMLDSDTDGLVEKMKAKLVSAPIATVDDSAL